jgi:aminopeptidase YwaD
MNTSKIASYPDRIFIVIFTALLLCSCNRAMNPEVTSDELLSHIKYLSSDSLQGRLTGSPGDSLAAGYIKASLVSCGFVPLAGDGEQRYMVTRRILPGKSCSLSLNGRSFSAGIDFSPAGFSADSELKSEVIFAGYGFNINTDSIKWNDYSGIDVKGKWVLILRADPETEDPNSFYVPFSGDRSKALTAKDMGAGGVLLVSGPASDPRDTFESLNSGDLSAGIPVLRIKREVADRILSVSGNTVASLEKKLNVSRRPAGFASGIIVSGRSELIRERTGTRNIVMLLPGEDPLLKDQYVILGAHFDHLGMGGPGSSSRMPDTSAVHHGADDNASGVAMMLEIAEKFALTKSSHKRSIICVAFSGEEEGLLGSRYFTDNPGIDLSKVNVMINLDMVGRLNDSTGLEISGTGTAEGLKELIYSESDTSGLKLRLSDAGYGPSDQTSFYGKNIPVLFYFTGAHLDYHTPSDTYDKINYSGMVKISGELFNVAEVLASADSMLSFRESGPREEPARYGRRKGVTLGIMPDFAGVVKNGLRVDAVDPGRPAALGGMKKGDIITAINGKSVDNIYDYMARMSQLKHGQTISVEVKRNGQKIVLLVQL